MSTTTKPANVRPKRESLGWKYLEARPESSKRQMYVKGSRLRAATVWIDIDVNGMTREKAALNFDLPVAAIDEIVRYCEANEELIRAEAEEERRSLREAGVQLEPPASR